MADPARAVFADPFALRALRGTLLLAMLASAAQLSALTPTFGALRLADTGLCGTQSSQARVRVRVEPGRVQLVIDGAPRAWHQVHRDQKGRLALGELVAALSLAQRTSALGHGVTLEVADEVRYDDLVQVIAACAALRVPLWVNPRAA